MNEPAASPDQRGNACVRNRTLSDAGSAAVALVILALLVHPSLELAKLRPLGGDLTADHPCREEDAPEKDAGLNDRPDPSLPDAIDPESGQRQNAGEHTENKDAEAEHREQQQRLLTEAKLEPDRKHIEHADRDATPGRELGMAGVSRVQRHPHFSNFETLGGRDHNHIAMPIGTDREAVHDLSAIGFDAVEVLDLHVEQQPAQAVVDAGNERLLVLPFLEAGNQVGFVGENGRDEPRNVLRLELQIGRIKNEHPPTGNEVAGAQRVGDPAAAPMPRKLEKLIAASELFEYRPAIVLRAIVDDDDLKRDIGRR